MDLGQRIEYINDFLSDISLTGTRYDKAIKLRAFLSSHKELEEDVLYVLDTLNGKHRIGWHFRVAMNNNEPDFATVKEMIQFLEHLPDKEEKTRRMAEAQIGEYGTFIARVVNYGIKSGLGTRTKDMAMQMETDGPRCRCPNCGYEGFMEPITRHKRREVKASNEQN